MPQTAITRVADVLVDPAAGVDDDARRAGPTERSSARRHSASRCADSAVNPLTSANSTVTWRRRSSSESAASCSCSAAIAASTTSSGSCLGASPAPRLPVRSCSRCAMPPPTVSVAPLASWVVLSRRFDHAALGDVRKAFATSDPARKARQYTELGVTMTYRTADRVVHVDARPVCTSSCPRTD